MYPSKCLPVFILLLSTLCLTAHGLDIAGPLEIAEKPANVEYPFLAKVTGNDIYVRSGKGTAYYHCSKVHQGETLTVFEETFGWAKILPPKGCYSWIHKNYVDVQIDNATVGVLNANNVRVWAGSDAIEPMRSSSMQTKLNSGEIIELFVDQPETGDYYKIKPPAGAYLWISCSYLKYQGPVQDSAPLTIPEQEPEQKPEQEPVKPATKTPKPPVQSNNTPPTFLNVPDESSTDENAAATETKSDAEPAEAVQADEIPKAETENLGRCYALSTKIDQQLQKPLTEQKYTDIRKELEKIKADETDSKAATYAQLLLERIQRYELAISVVDTLKKQDEALAKAKEKVEEERRAKLKELPVEVEYLYAGVLKVSHVYTQKSGQKRYLVKNPDGKILCYAIPSTEQVAGQLEGFIDKKVGIQGTVSSNKESLVTLVSVSSVDLLE